MVEARVLEVRDAHPAWGARKIARRLVDLGHQVPSVSTVHAILVRHGRVTACCGGTGQPWQRRQGLYQFTVTVFWNADPYRQQLADAGIPDLIGFVDLNLLMVETVAPPEPVSPNP